MCIRDRAFTTNLSEDAAPVLQSFSYEAYDKADSKLGGTLKLEVVSEEGVPNIALPQYTSYIRITNIELSGGAQESQVLIQINGKTYRIGENISREFLTADSNGNMPMRCV